MRPFFFFVVLSVLLAACAASGVTDGTYVEEEDSGTTGTGDADTKKDSGSGKDSGTSSDARGDTTTSDAPADAPKDSVVDAPVDAPVDSPVDSGNCQTVPPNNLCGVNPQCGCGANMTCDVTNELSGATSCITAGSKAMGQNCNSTGECAVGLTCAFDVCRAYCSTPNTSCARAGTGVCFAPDNSQGNPTPNRNVCTIQCDPRSPAAVCGANGCAWFGANTSDCRAMGAGTQDAICTHPQQCAIGYHCVPFLSAGFCERWCRLGGGDCTGGYTCVDSLGANKPIINGVSYGTCQ